MAILAKSLLALMGGNLVAFTLTTARHRLYLLNRERGLGKTAGAPSVEEYATPMPPLCFDAL